MSIARRGLAAALSATLLGIVALPGCTGSMTDRIARDRDTLRSMSIGEVSIPAAALRQSKAVVVLELVNVAAVVGVTGGGGTMVRNLGDGRWSAPLALTVVAGSLGLQIGGEGRSVVLVLNDEVAVERILSQDAYPLAGLAAVAGPAAAEAYYDGMPVPSIYSYSRSGGLFVGAMLGGLGIVADRNLNRKIYGDATPRSILSGEVPAPPGGLAYAAALDSLAGTRTALAYEGPEANP